MDNPVEPLSSIILSLISDAFEDAIVIPFPPLFIILLLKILTLLPPETDIPVSALPVTVLLLSIASGQNGITVSDCHGEWPYESWGINRRDDAWFRLEFGRTVEVDRVVIYTRADYPHDNWWKQGMIAFSDGSTLELNLKKTGTAQEFLFEKRQIEWLELKNLIKAESATPFPALVQIEVYGRESGFR